MRGSNREPSEGPPLGRLAHREQAHRHQPEEQAAPQEQHRSPPHLLRQDPRAARGPQPPRAADRQLRLAARQRRVAGPGRAGPQRRTRRRARQVRPRGDLRGDQPDRGLPGHHVAVVPRPSVRAAQVLDRGVQGTRHHLLGAAVRHRRVHEQHDRRDQEPDGLHGRLPADDRQGHLHHQRHRACRGVPAGPLARRLLRQVRRQDLGQGPLRLQDHPVPRCLARVRDRQARPGRRPRRPQAQAVGHRAAQGPRLGRRQDPRGVRRSTSRSAPPWRRTTPPARTTRCSTSTASCARASRPRGRPRRRCWTTSTSTPSATTSPRSAATRSTRSWASGSPLGLQRPDDRRHRRDHPVHRQAARRRDRRWTARTARSGSRSTTSTTSATGACARSAS